MQKINYATSKPLKTVCYNLADLELSKICGGQQTTDSESSFDTFKKGSFDYFKEGFVGNSVFGMSILAIPILPFSLIADTFTGFTFNLTGNIFNKPLGNDLHILTNTAVGLTTGALLTLAIKKIKNKLKTHN